MTTGLTWLQGDQPFPAPETALKNPNGLLAAGGDLSSTRLISAYRQGIFPWFSGGQPPLWWSPDPRAVLFPEQLHISTSLRKQLRRSDWRVRSDQRFSEVVAACAENRGEGTWILPEVRAAYEYLHHLGRAHSIEIMEGQELVGGLYGLTVGNLFCGESMFYRRDNASKVAFVVAATVLFSSGFKLIDCQLENPHLRSLGVEPVSRQIFIDILHSGRDVELNWPIFDSPVSAWS